MRNSRRMIQVRLLSVLSDVAGRHRTNFGDKILEVRPFGTLIGTQRDADHVFEHL